MTTIEFWYEFASTYSYPAAMRISDIAAKAGVKVKWCPFLLGPIFKAQGWADSPFNIYPLKGVYMWRDMERICQHYNLAFTRPVIFPQNGLNAARLTLSPVVLAKRAEFSRRVYQAAFARQQDISSLETLTEILKSLAIDEQQALSQAASPEVKAALRTNTETAIKKQIFGAPSFVTPDGELFWGDDRLEQAVAWRPG